MGAAEWLLVLAIVCVFAFVVLRPDRTVRPHTVRLVCSGSFAAASR